MSVRKQTNAVVMAGITARIIISTPAWPKAESLVCATDLPRVLDGNGRWGAHLCARRMLYASRTRRTDGRRWTELMHRVILGLGPSRHPVVDHANRDALDNRRPNLRVTSQIGNGANARHGRGTSAFKGVFLRRRTNGSPRWRAGIMVAGDMHWLGTFDTEVMAAAAYDNAARLYSGEFALTNLGGTDAIHI